MKTLWKSGLTLAALSLTSLTYAQTGTTSSSATAPTNAVNTSADTTVSPTPPPPPGTSAAPATVQEQAQVNAANAQANAEQTNPTQAAPQQAGGGVFGPSQGPGIFGPADTQPVTDIYGHQVPAGSMGNPVQSNIPALGESSNPTRPSTLPAQNPTLYDANGQVVGDTLYPRSDLPRAQNPITPSGTEPLAQPLQTPPSGTSGTVTGR